MNRSWCAVLLQILVSEFKSCNFLQRCPSLTDLPCNSIESISLLVKTARPQGDCDSAAHKFSYLQPAGGRRGTQIRWPIVYTNSFDHPRDVRRHDTREKKGACEINGLSVGRFEEHRIEEKMRPHLNRLIM